jgi:hypothetical protein
MSETDAVRRFLRGRGCPDDVVAGGIEGLIAEWERIAGDVERGYSLGLDDYLNDLDTRQLLEQALSFAPAAAREALAGRILAADERMKRCVAPTDECLWGRRVAEAEGWTPDENWWYFGIPRAPGSQLREDLERG